MAADLSLSRMDPGDSEEERYDAYRELLRWGRPPFEGSIWEVREPRPGMIEALLLEAGTQARILSLRASSLLIYSPLRDLRADRSGCRLARR